MRTLAPAFRTLPSTTYWAPSFRPTSVTSGDCPLNAKDELRAMTETSRKWASAVMMSSVMPSEKYSCSGSPDMFTNGSTAIEGLSESGSSGG